MPGYRALGQWHDVSLLPLSGTDMAEMPGALGARVVAAAVQPMATTAASSAAAETIVRAIGESTALRARLGDPGDLCVVQGRVPARRAAASAARAPQVPISTYGATTIATRTVIAEGLRTVDLKAAQDFGATLVEEGLDGKSLLRLDTVEQAFGLIELLLKRDVGSVAPNFLRRIAPPRPAAAPKTAWSHARIGVAEAWAITKGSKDITIAVLDEGVDTTHPALKPAVVAERDFIGGNGASAMPGGDDAHGTACSGVALSRDATYAGIAPRCSLIAARIAMDDGSGNWIIEDWSTADAIDWAWRQGADVLSNSWGGGAPSDSISRAFARARTQGRGGRGAVVVIAAGNAQSPIDFPGNLPGYVTVGASTPADERKTRTSSDGETWWGSNFGATMTLLAPGVFIWTTDIVGAAGYGRGNFTKTFNGTSSATPAVAGAAALMLSANLELSASVVRDLLGKTARKLKGQKTWTPELGWGRLDVGKAVAAAKVAGTPAAGQPVKKTRKPAKKTKKTAKTKTTKTKKATKTRKSKKPSPRGTRQQ
jgi:subtilisin family serine protease